MPKRVSTAAALAGALLAPGLAAAQSAPAFSVSPAGPGDLRSAFVSPNGAVFVVDAAHSQIVMCYPDNANGKWIVSCTAPTKLPQ